MKQKKENPGIAMKIYRLERWFYEHKINIVTVERCVFKFYIV